ARVYRGGENVRARKRRGRSAVPAEAAPPAPAPVSTEAYLSTRHLTAGALELPHERDEGVDSLFRKGVVDRGPHAADRTMALQSIESGCCGLFHKGLLELFGGKPECHVHQRAVLLPRRPTIKPGAVDLGVQLCSLALVDFRDRSQPT